MTTYNNPRNTSTIANKYKDLLDSTRKKIKHNGKWVYMPIGIKGKGGKVPIDFPVPENNNNNIKKIVTRSMTTTTTVLKQTEEWNSFMDTSNIQTIGDFPVKLDEFNEFNVTPMVVDNSIPFYSLLNDLDKIFDINIQEDI